MDDKSWVKLYRKAKENEIMRDANAWLLFCWILLSVDRETGKWKVGRFLLGKLLNIPPSTARNALKRIEKKYGIIRTDSRTGSYTEVSVLKWDKYQSNNNLRTGLRTERGQVEDTYQEENKNINIISSKKIQAAKQKLFRK